MDNFKPFGEMKVKPKKYIVSRVVLSTLMLLGFLGMFSALWYSNLFGDVGVESVVFTVLAGFAGVQGGLVGSWVLNALLPSVLITGALVFVLLLLPYILYQGRDEERFARNRRVSAVLAIVAFLMPFFTAFRTVGLDSFVINLFSETKIYEEEYADPAETEITFPEKKRNLIYIYLESMETTFFSQEQGGGLEENAIPELHSLAKENINFSQNDGVGGGRTNFGSTWTIAAMISQTAGIPMRSPNSVEASVNRKFFNGAASINSVLKDNGYNQALMVGSQAEYGGREEYFLQHGVDKIYDLESAYEDGIVPKGYFEWWGMEDKYLYSYAKQKITEMAEKDEPFAFTMLTADTHHVDGYFCSECRNTFDEQYTNVLGCSARQVTAFVEWVKQQDFYENTTIVITGDHGTMDYQFIKENVKKGYTRRIYNCFINSAASAEYSKNREFLTLDMFPTTLAALGCSIEGDRLGLGTNLFSGKQTLVEQYGYKYVNNEISKRSDFYNTQFD